MTPNSAGTTQLPVDGVVKPAVPDVNGRTETIEKSDAKEKKTDSMKESSNTKESSAGSNDCPASPQVQVQPYHQTYLPHLTPQAGGAYYLYGNHQVTPEPPSPAAPGYDVTSFLQQQAALALHPGNPFGTAGQYGAIPQAPLSPSRSGMSGGLIPPASPLFPRAATNNPVGMSGSFEHHNQLDSSVIQRIQGQTPASPSVPYMSASLANGFGTVYPGYSPTGTYATALSGAANQAIESSTSAGENGGWGDRKNSQQLYTQASPQVQGLPGTYPGGRSASNRSYSFDEMLPPSVLDPQDQISVPYSPYSNNQGSSTNTLIAHQQPWAYGSGDMMYNPPQSPIQQRTSPHAAGHFPAPHPGMGPPPMHHLPYGAQQLAQQHMPPFYPATSPGPPIQTTSSNKGPDGANLFIFHIPNHFTNLDMYRLFCQYGNLLSVRIMVEKDTGRSRGFGFVSYDSPESAALAIKELNGFAVGNKRLKVQHKQIRGDQQRSSFNGSVHAGDPSFMPRPELPSGGTSSGMGISSSPWYEAKPSAAVGTANDAAQDDTADLEGNPDENTNTGVAAKTVGLPPIMSVTEQSKTPVAFSALNSLDPLLNALPDVTGHTGTVE